VERDGKFQLHSSERESERAARRLVMMLNVIVRITRDDSNILDDDCAWKVAPECG
jgi:hypothetical protein